MALNVCTSDKGYPVIRPERNYDANQSLNSCRSILSDDIRDEAETKAFRKKLKHFGLHEHFTAVYTFILRTSYTGSLQILFYKHNYYTCSFKNKFVLNLQTAIIFHMNFMHSLRQTCGWPNSY